MLTFLGAAGAFLLVLVVIFIVGRLWFALVETVKDAVLRRFSRKLLVDLPDAEQREKILKVILRKEKLSDDVDLKAIASDSMTKGFSSLLLATKLFLCSSMVLYSAI